MGTMNISLPNMLREFVDMQVVDAGYRSSGEYVRELIRRDHDRVHLRARVLDGAGSAVSGEADGRWFEVLRTGAAGQKAMSRPE